MTLTQRNAIASPAAGLQVIVTGETGGEFLSFYNSSTAAWQRVVKLTSAGRLLLGTTTEGNNILDVVGKTRLTGSSSEGVLELNQTSIGFSTQIINRVNTTNALAQIQFSDKKTGAGNRSFGIGIGRSGDPQWDNGDFIFAYFTGTGGWEQSAKIFNANGNWAIGNGTATADVPSAKLQINSTTQGVLFPRMTTVQKLAIGSPAAGLQVYDTTLNQMSYYNGTTWVNF
jgi:hypothetical protein